MIPKKLLSVKVRIIILLLLCAAIFVVLSSKDYPRSATIRLSVLSPGQEILQLFWLNPEGMYSQKKSSVVNLTPGGHDYTLLIEPSTTISKLRLDPAIRKSIIEIEQMELKWDGITVFSLTGKDLMRKFSVVQGAALKYNQQHDRVIIVCLGNDPILELNIDQLTGSFKRAKILRHMLLALLITLFLIFPLLYLTSESYSTDSHFTYPQLKRHWGYWGVSCMFLGGFFVAVIPITLPDKNTSLYFTASSYITGVLLFVSAFWFVTRKISFSRSGELKRFYWFWFALPSFLVWSFYLLSFWPGSMSPDSLDQWKQVLNGNFRDWHPAFHTMTIWLITRIKLSPAVVVIAQIIALGSAVGWALGVLQQHGISKRVLWLTSVLFALWPVNGFMVITLWKDLAYSIVLLVLAIYVFQIVMRNGIWLSRPKNWFLLGSIIALVSLYRHNGIIPAFIIVLLLLCFYLRYWKGIVFAAIIAMMIHTGIRGPLYNALDVRRGNPMTLVQQKLKSDILAAYYTKLNSKQIQQTLSKTKEQLSKTDITEVTKSVQHSGPIWDRLYSASILWRIVPIDFYYTRIDFVNLWHKVRDEEIRIKYVSGNKLGVKENSVIPAGMEILYKIFNESRYNKYLFWMWRPSVYLYAWAGLSILLSWRLRKKLYLVLIPSLVNSLPIFLVVVHKSIFRYHYPIVVLALVMIIPLLFLKNVQEDDYTGDLT